ncbi:hypothetical protein Bca4012_102123 [Brassica carinata]
MESTMKEKIITTRSFEAVAQRRTLPEGLQLTESGNAEIGWRWSEMRGDCQRRTTRKVVDGTACMGTVE